eukprot:UN00555
MYFRLLAHGHQWNGMKQQCIKYAETCEICQRFNSRPTKFLPFNQNIIQLHVHLMLFKSI